MFRRAIFAHSQREVILAPHHPEQFGHTIIWLVLAYVHAIVVEFRQLDRQTQQTYSPYVYEVVRKVVNRLFKERADALLPNWEKGYLTHDLLLELAQKVEQGRVHLNTDDGRLNIGLSAKSMSEATANLDLTGYQRPWMILEDLVATAALRAASTFELDAAASLTKRMAPHIKTLRSIGTPCSTAAADFLALIATWKMEKDWALVFTP